VEIRNEMPYINSKNSHLFFDLLSFFLVIVKKNRRFNCLTGFDLHDVCFVVENVSV